MPVVTRARSNALSSAASSPYPASAPPRPQRKPVKKPKKVEVKTKGSPAPQATRSSRKRSLDDDIRASTGRIDDEEVDAGRPLKRSKTAPAPNSKGKKVTTVAAPRNVLAAADQAEPVDDRAEAEPTEPATNQAQHHRKKETARPARTTAAAPVVPALPLAAPFGRFGISAALAQSARAMESAAHAAATPRSAPMPGAGARGGADGLADMREQYYSRFRQYAGIVSQARGDATIALVQETGSKGLYLATTFQGAGTGQKTYRLVARRSLPSPTSSGIAAAGPSGATAVQLGRTLLKDVAHSSLEGLVDHASKMLNGGASFETVKAKLVQLAHSRDQGRFSASDDSPNTSNMASSSNGLTITDSSN
ncbi:hypothetical protein Rhopal_002611-T1 [Rhodotorula paludigena]|uniref:Uncharacterized protein n=1 Tax=Rhodotorula paludigena TaxID=86838 RepID=A0AAV5GI73_9BASI|nr:hypothetical protein Rhopal_002611-T1 [Rhodotorula paludigena]